MPRSAVRSASTCSSLIANAGRLGMDSTGSSQSRANCRSKDQPAVARRRRAPVGEQRRSIGRGASPRLPGSAQPPPEEAETGDPVAEAGGFRHREVGPPAGGLSATADPAWVPRPATRQRSPNRTPAALLPSTPGSLARARGPSLRGMPPPSPSARRGQSRRLTRNNPGKPAACFGQGPRSAAGLDPQHRAHRQRRGPGLQDRRGALVVSGHCSPTPAGIKRTFPPSQRPQSCKHGRPPAPAGQGRRGLKLAATSPTASPAPQRRRRQKPGLGGGAQRAAMRPVTKQAGASQSRPPS